MCVIEVPFGRLPRVNSTTTIGSKIKLGRNDDLTEAVLLVYILYMLWKYKSVGGLEYYNSPYRAGFDTCFLGHHLSYYITTANLGCSRSYLLHGFYLACMHIVVVVEFWKVG
jgi:hypothetical protein